MAKACQLAPEAAARLFKERLTVLRQQAAPARAETVDGVHDLRVASRRLRAFLGEHRYLGEKKTVKRLRKEARSITRLLGIARELDVCLGLLEQHRPSFHDAPRQGIIYSARRFRALRQAESPQVQAAAAQATAPAFMEDCLAFFEGLRPAPVCYLKQATGSLMERFRNLYRVHDFWKALPTGETLHRVRIAFKKLRYTGELYVPLYGQKMDHFLRELKQAQEALGNWNDCRVLRDYLEDFEAKAPPKTREGLPTVIAFFDTEAERYLDAFAATAPAFFAYENLAVLEQFFAKPVMPCCKSKGVDRTALDKLY